LCPDDHTACNSKRAVQPRCHDHSAVPLHIQTGIVSIFQKRILPFDLKGWGIAVACQDLEPTLRLLRDPESYDGRTVAFRIILASANDRKCFCLRQIYKSLLLQSSGNLLHRVERAWAFVYKGN